MNSNFYRKLKDNSGDGLAELMVAMAIGVIVALAMASLFTFGIQQFGLLVEENKAEESLLQSAYMMKAYLSQAVKITCAPGAMAVGLTLVADANVPGAVPNGLIDCRGVDAPPTAIDTTPGHTWNAGVKNPFAVFFREIGGATAGASTGTGYSASTNAGGSTYIGTGIYFTPPAGNTTGVLTFAQQATGNTIDTQVAAQWDHIVDFGVINNSVCSNTSCNGTAAVAGANSEPGNLESMNIRIVARYYTIFQNDVANYNYNPAVGSNINIGWRDIEISVPIAFRDTYLGVNTTGTQTPERLYGGLYFFRFTAPPLTSFDF